MIVLGGATGGSKPAGAAEADHQGLRQDQRHRQGQGHRRAAPSRSPARTSSSPPRCSTSPAMPAAARSWSAATTAAASRSRGCVNNQSAVLENYAIATATTVSVDGATTFNASATGERQRRQGDPVVGRADHLRRHHLRPRRRARRRRRLRRGVGQAAAGVHRARSTRCAPNGAGRHAAARSIQCDDQR